MRLNRLGCLLVLLSSPCAFAQSAAHAVKPILDHSLQAREVASFELQEYLMRRAPGLPAPASASQWGAEGERIRQHLLNDVIFHGWPQAWVKSPPHFEDLGPIDSGKGYRRRKLRYEIVPGFYSTAILYTPDVIEGLIPAVLVVMGHHGAIGKAVEFEQKLCINLALRGMAALNLEWIGMGELFDSENTHWFQSALDLVGTSGVGLFYLAMRRGLDYLATNPQVDPKRLGVTGLSGGGWQTIVLSALDSRVYASVPVAGYNSQVGRIGRMPLAGSEGGDLEQQATDFLAGQDYSTLTAMRAPRPTLLINNAEDDCCFRAPLVKPYIFDAIVPFFDLYGKRGNLQFHENIDIPAHNYELDNREQAYRFFARSFGLKDIDHEIPVDDQIVSYDQLSVGIPRGNLTILGLARQLAGGISRPPLPTTPVERGNWAAAERDKLRNLIRYVPVEVREVWGEGNSREKGIQSLWYRFELSDGLSATGIWMKAVATPDDAPLTIAMDDKGKKAAGEEVWNRMPWVADLVDRGQQVLVLDTIFFGDSEPDQPAFFLADALAAEGMRPLGIESAQLAALSHWAGKQWKPRQLRLETAGIRSQIAGLVTTALEPQLFAETQTHGGMTSLRYLLDEPVTYQEAPELFCLDLYKVFDLDRLAALAEPAKVGMFQALSPDHRPTPLP